MLQKKWVALESLCQWDVEEAGDPISLMGIWQPNDALKTWLQMTGPHPHFHNIKERKQNVESSCSFCDALNLSIEYETFFHCRACHLDFPSVTSLFHVPSPSLFHHILIIGLIVWFHGGSIDYSPILTS